jgi:hypothetical protein
MMSIRKINWMNRFGETYSEMQQRRTQIPAELQTERT